MHLVGIEDALAVDRNVGRVRRPRAASNYKIIAAQQGITFFAGDLHAMGVKKARIAFVNRDPVAPQLRLDDLNLARHYRVGTEDEVFHADAVFYGITAAVEGTLAQSAEVEDGLAKGLAGDGASVDTDAADGALALDDGDLLAQLGRADGSLLSRRAAADDDEVVDGVVDGFRRGQDSCLLLRIRQN